MHEFGLREFAEIVKRKLLEEAAKNNERCTSVVLVTMTKFVDKLLEEFEYEVKMKKFLEDPKED